MTDLVDAASPAAGTRSASRGWTERYLALLGVAPNEPGLGMLSALVRAHKLTVPFANVGSVLRRYEHMGAPVPRFEPEAMLATWEEKLAGGVCFELAEMFYLLLRDLGFDARRILGTVKQPGDHQATVVDIEGRRYLADVGSGMPMLAPVLLEGERELSHAGIRVRLRPGASEDEWLQERWTDEGWSTVFLYDLRDASDDLRSEAYQRHHTPGYNFVATSMTVVRCTEEAQFELRGDVFVSSTEAERVTSPVEDTAEAVGLVREVMGLPDLAVPEAMAALEAVKAHAGLVAG